LVVVVCLWHGDAQEFTDIPNVETFFSELVARASASVGEFPEINQVVFFPVGAGLDEEGVFVMV